MERWNPWLLIGCVSLWSTLAPPAAAQPQFAFSRDAGTVVVEFAELPSLLHDEDPGPSMRIYGNGRVEVHRPAYMRPAGDFEWMLTAEQLDALVGALVARRLPEFDARAVRSRLDEAARAARAAGKPLRSVSDDVTSEFVLHLDLYRPGGGPAQRGVRKQITWPSLRGDARQHPQDRAIQDLAAAQRELLLLMNDPERVRAP